jgi:TonB family protein
MVARVTLLLLLFICTAHAQNLRWRGYPAPRSGVVVATVDRSGKVTGTKILESTGDPGLDAVALSKFKEWHFKPGTAKQVKIPITFTPAGAKY